MRMEKEGPAWRTKPQIHEAALRRGGLAGERSSVAWCMRYVAEAYVFASRRGPIRCVRPPVTSGRRM